jgi:RNA polymerase sigma-70 factor, ECF subfamily
MTKTTPFLAAALTLSEAPDADTDDRLAVRARHDPQAFAALYDRYLPQVYRYMVSRVSSPADAEDLTAQVFLAAFESRSRYRPGNSFRAWLFGIARRKAVDDYRKRAPQVPLELAGEIAAPAGNLLAQMAQKDTLRRLAGLITRLQEEERELLRLRFAGQLSFAEIAHLLGRKESAVKMMLYRLLERLEKQMEGNQ